MADSLSFKQELTGVFGFPVADNPTQAMMEPAYAALGLSWRYLTVEVRPENLGEAVRGARAMQWKGFNCTIPHKVAVIEHLDRLSPAAQAIGAVNCVSIRNGELWGDNADGKGFLESLASIRSVEGLSVVILGAGGAARAIAVELALAGAASITIVNRTRQRGLTLSALINERTAARGAFLEREGNFQVPSGTDLLVNATSIGLYPDLTARVPVDTASLESGTTVCDVIPNPPHTMFLADAAARGCTVIDGLGMLVNQGAIAIKLWSGREPDQAVMRDALRQVFASSTIG
jgi:shikimate dehydrogenase